MWADMPARRRTGRILRTTGACVLLCTGAGHAADKHRVKATPQSHSVTADWPVYGGQKADDRYSPLRQINRSNVGKLGVAWTYDTGEKGVGMQTSPLIVGRTLYAYTPTQKVIALDA